MNHDAPAPWFFVAHFQAGLPDAPTAMQELRGLSDETGMFGSITDETIAANAGKTYQDVTALRDPLAGLTGGTDNPFDASAAGTVPTADYSPDQPRDEHGRWTNGSSSGKFSTNEKKTAIIELDNNKYALAESKLSKFLLKPGAKHSAEFFAVGYSEQDAMKLNADIYRQFDESLKTDVHILDNGAERFSLFMELGIDKKKMFRTVWLRDPGDKKPRLITAHREGKKK